MSESTSGAAPRTTWEYCLSAADELTLHQPPPGSELQGQVVLMLAAVLAGCADAEELTGASVADLPLDGRGGLLGRLRSGARFVVRVCPAPPGLGGEQREALLALDREAFRSVQALAEGVVETHLAAAGDRVPTVREAVAASSRARTLRRAQAALGIDDED